MAQEFKPQAAGHGDGSDPREHSIPELMRALAEETTTLMRQELDLAKAEMAQKGKQAGLGIGMFGAAGIIALFALGALTACFIAALAAAMPAWLGALLVTMIYAASAGAVALVANLDYSRQLPQCPNKRLKPSRRMWNGPRPKRNPGGNRRDSSANG